MNKVFLIGNLTRDVEFETTNAGKQMAKFGLAVKRKFADETDFFNITAWGTLAENCAKFLKKGSKCHVVARLQNNQYEVNGEKRYSINIIADEVEFLGSKVQKQEDLVPVDDPGDLPF